MNTVFQWVSGVRPPPYSWKKWNLLLMQGSDAAANNGACWSQILVAAVLSMPSEYIGKSQPLVFLLNLRWSVMFLMLPGTCQGIQGGPSTGLSVIVGFGSCNIAGNIVSDEEDSRIMDPKSAGKSATPRQLDLDWDDLIGDAEPRKARKASGVGGKEDITAETAAMTESHYIGAGPDFRAVIFKLGAQSPLIAHYLKMHEIPHAPTGTLVQQLKHVEICSFPTLAVPTYQDIIKETQELRKSLQKDYMKLQEKSRTEIAEIELQKVRVNRRFSRLKKQITGENRRYNALLLEKMEKISFFSDAFKAEDVPDRSILNEDAS